MNRIAAAAIVFLVATSSFAQATYDTNLRLERADGSVQLIPGTPPPLDSVIVEFRDAPLAVARAGKTALPDYQATFNRFRGDLTTIDHAHRAGKAALPADVAWEYYRLFHGVSVRVPREELAAIAQLPYVKQIHADHEMRAMAGPAVSQVGADRAWALGSRGKGVVVAIIDTGIDYNHEALGNGFGPGHKIIGGFDFVNHDADPIDDNGHGTHVAGIIAGDSATITGIAPEASLIAYKALGANGSGSESNVIAAMERASDPNLDGNLSDHVDVVNLSLGGTGGPDDPASRAADTGGAIGIVFCIAAGNSGKYHSVSSPGTARTAITVGAVDGADLVAAFSSRGPTPKDLSMKPEVSAPGVSITSSLPGNRYGALSGTSMATPHVAGAAALLKALHPDWTPAQIKAQLMLTGFAKSQEAMAVGAGRIDAAAAADNSLTIDNASIDFGLDPVQQATWSTSRVIHLTNHSDQSATWNLSTTTVPGVDAHVTPPTLTLAAGQTNAVTVSVTVDNAAATVSPSSLAAGGVVSVTDGAATFRLPWTFVKAVRSTVTWSREIASIVWLDAARTQPFDSVALDSNVAEALFPSAGDYDVFVYGLSLDSHTGALTRGSFLYLPAQHLDGDTTIVTNEAQASHVVRGATTAPDGSSLQIGADQTYAIAGRLVWPPSTSAIKSFAVSPLPVHELHFNDIAADDKLFIDETYVDFVGNNLYAVQHAPLQGLSSDVTLAATNLISAPVRLLIPSAAKDDARVVANVTPFSIAGADLTPALSIAHLTGDAASWNGRVYLTPDIDPTYSAGISFSVTTDGTQRYITPQLHVLNGAVTANASLLPQRFDGDLFLFGGGPHLVTASYTNINTLLRPSLFIDSFGPRGESRTGDRGQTTVTTLDAGGRQKATVSFYPAPLDLSVKAAYTLEVTNNQSQYNDLPTQTKLTMKLDSSRTDYLPPTLTSIYIVDGGGTATRSIAPHGSGAIYFSAADYAYTPLKSYQPVRADATVLSYRYAGATAWTPLTLSQVSEDPVNGFLYRADLAGVANTGWAPVELKIDLTDNAGNTTSVVMLPAFMVEDQHPLHRRPVR